MAGAESTSIAFDFLITLVFAAVSLLFLFPSNKYLPLDRRLAGLLGSALCTFLIYVFPQKERNNTLYDVDVAVLLVLIAIMAINFVIMRQPVLLSAIRIMQEYIQRDINSGFWLVSLVSFAVSPFIMNDGLCLLLVTPVLDAFCQKDAHHEYPQQSMDLEQPDYSDELSADDDDDDDTRDRDSSSRNGNSFKSNSPLSPSRSDPSHKQPTHSSSDPFYFMLAIACSANIGSATTFSGNPQNIIVAQYLAQYMNCGLFFGLLIAPALASWLLTTCLINFYRIRAANKERDAAFSGGGGDTARRSDSDRGVEMRGVVTNRDFFVPADSAAVAAGASSDIESGEMQSMAVDGTTKTKNRATGEDDGNSGFK